MSESTKAPAILTFSDVSKSYDSGDGGTREVLSGVNLSLASGQTVALVGRSGSGKSTLLNLAAGIDVATTGTVGLAGRDLAQLSEVERTLTRRHTVGMIFQFFHLLPHLSVEENVALPGWIAGQDNTSLTERTEELLRRVDLWDRRRDRAGLMSGGEMQRVAICRALLPRPRLLLADEPTGSLDDANGRVVMKLLLELTLAEGATLLYVTHSQELAKPAGRVLRLQGGTLSRTDGEPL